MKRLIKDIHMNQIMKILSAAMQLRAALWKPVMLINSVRCYFTSVLVIEPIAFSYVVLDCIKLVFTLILSPPWMLT